MGCQVSLDTAWRGSRGRLDTPSGHSRALVNVGRCFIGSNIASGLSERIGGEQAVCSPPLWALGRVGELQPLLKRVSEGERIFRVELKNFQGAWR